MEREHAAAEAGRARQEEIQAIDPREHRGPR
jgi:hypothetical protein